MVHDSKRVTTGGKVEQLSRSQLTVGHFHLVDFVPVFAQQLEREIRNSGLIIHAENKRAGLAFEFLRLKAVVRESHRLECYR